MLTLDAIILSHAATPEAGDMTRACIHTMLRAIDSTKYKLRITVVEGCPEFDLDIYDALPVRIVNFPQAEFNFNLAVKAGLFSIAQAFPVESGERDCVLISNNDVIYEADCLNQLIAGLEYVDSVSPWFPGFHNDWHQCGEKPVTNIIEGISVRGHVCGWSYAFNRHILGGNPDLTIEGLFPDSVAFWYQDNYYAEVLKLSGVRHALIRDARAEHLNEQSHEFMDGEYRLKATTGMAGVYRDSVIELAERFATRRAEVGKSKRFLLTICVCSLPERMSTTCAKLIRELERQAASAEQVQILSLTDNRSKSVGCKRNELVRIANGDFVAFVDDDDEVAPDYVSTLKEAILLNPSVDCITFPVMVEIDGTAFPCHYDPAYAITNDADHYRRPPNHLCCWHRDLMLDFPEINLGEDNLWSLEMKPRCKVVHRLGKPLYTYRYNPATSATVKRPEASTSNLSTGKRHLKIAVYSICLNEAKQIRGYMDSIKDADGVFVADTGSTDDSVTLLREAGAHVSQVCIKPWRFDHARNASLFLVPGDYDVCIKLDIDERMDPGWRNAIEAVWKKGKTTRLHYDFNMSPTNRYRASWIHARHGYEWRWPIHEFLAATEKEYSIEVAMGLSTTHLQEQGKESRGNYLNMLQRYSKTDTSSRILYYLGREYSSVQKHKECIATLEKYLKHEEATWTSERMSACMMIAESHLALKDRGQYESWMMRAHHEEPWAREPLTELAYNLYWNGQPALALGLAQKSMKITHRQGHTFHTVRAWDETTYSIAFISAHDLGLKEEAAKYMRKALETNPNSAYLKENAKFVLPAHEIPV